MKAEVCFFMGLLLGGGFGAFSCWVLYERELRATYAALRDCYARLSREVA